MSEKPKLPIARVDTVDNFLNDVLLTKYFDEEKGLIHRFEPGEGRLLLVTGENATGKSLLRRIVQAALDQHKIECMGLSMQKRAGSFRGMEASFIWGDENCMSTGSCSGNAITGAARTSRQRTETHSIFWDEPDVGLSDNYAAGAALDILDFMKDAPAKLFLAVVVTHRRAMLKEFLKANPHHIRLGDKLGIRDVLRAKITPRRMEDLAERNIGTYRRLYKEFGL